MVCVLLIRAQMYWKEIKKCCGEIRVKGIKDRETDTVRDGKQPF